MNETVRSNIIKLLNGSLDAIKKSDSFQLKELSNGNIHNASIFQDEDSLSISVAIYALSKVIERTQRKKAIVSHLQSALKALHSGNNAKYRAIIRSLLNAIKVEDYKLKRFVSNVIEQAQVKKGCAICEHGISIGRTANILGISQWELTRYLGKTHIAEQSSERVPTEQRLALARRIFK
ncbi:hypothetical protein CMO88_00540 [Candidatus Woesearchaeota archaeon]|nr:hypothetical protein [Candidatus Woesearchaeota archaeon]|tara:strand:+ start:22005 stop:22541 length:537 start_codon:yes stop_codon:yes gene_type:complete